MDRKYEYNIVCKFAKEKRNKNTENKKLNVNISRKRIDTDNTRQRTNKNQEDKGEATYKR